MRRSRSARTSAGNDGAGGSAGSADVLAGPGAFPRLSAGALRPRDPRRRGVRRRVRSPLSGAAALPFWGAAAACGAAGPVAVVGVGPDGRGTPVRAEGSPARAAVFPVARMEVIVRQVCLSGARTAPGGHVVQRTARDVCSGGRCGSQ
ncbi:hypothetical protein GCM10023215_66470 [Pseudonocardia yuanmonensis]|uniref:Uncharacterized protein n=1 Tax=Pseudonocardia yuanmonensis TaxID=1095914 RepID=A0ABP8XVK1_9PSEU